MRSRRGRSPWRRWPEPLLALGFLATRGRSGRHAQPLVELPAGAARVFALSAGGAALLVATTAWVGSLAVAHPLLWTVPLALYLATFAIAFDRGGWMPHGVVRWTAFALLVAGFACCGVGRIRA